MFETEVDYRKGRWEWRVHDRQGKILLQGSESTRAEAKYQSERGLFLLLMVPNPKFRATENSGDHE
jgi:hypothetical protein